ncbi:hypothetical protein JMJ35_009104 [Cladonia borealis]|uniref:MARVEL domain-containing protein n=1 Tax=Cladonia borealis TaxID=184061 RepID=A0AA39UYI2_9LECA|nr:hypothetical protein JMJ35_009104 [Cladonia borealis]
MLEIISLAICAVQFLFAIIVLGLTGHVSALTDGYATPSQDAFELFCAVFTILVVIYLAASPRLFDRKLHHPFIVLGLNAITMLFWFAAFIAMAVFHHNLEEVDFFDGFDGNVYGVCGLIGSYCPSVEAAAIFGAFEWALFAAATALAALAIFQNREKSMGSGPQVSTA